MHQVVVGILSDQKKKLCSYFFLESSMLTVPIITLIKSVPYHEIDFLSFHIRLVHLKTFRGREKRLMMIVTRPTQSLKLLIFIDFD